MKEIMLATGLNILLRQNAKKDAERARTTGVIFCFFNLKQKPND